jgi:hypothetical protein
MWCGDNHLHKDCPEKENTSSTLTCCNCQLAEGETAHPSNYRGCRHPKEELQQKGVQKNTQDFDWKDVIFKIYHPNPVLRSDPSRQLGTKEATTSTPGFSSRSGRAWEFEKRTATRKGSVSQGSKCKQFVLRQYTESINCSITNYDRVQECWVRTNQE